MERSFSKLYHGSVAAVAVAVVVALALSIALVFWATVKPSRVGVCGFTGP